MDAQGPHLPYNHIHRIVFSALPPSGVDAMIVMPLSRVASLYTALNLISHRLPGLSKGVILEVA